MRQRARFFEVLKKEDVAVWLYWNPAR